MGPEAKISVRSLQNKKGKKNSALAKVAAVPNDELDRALTIDGDVANATVQTTPSAASSRSTPIKFSWAEAVVYGEVVNADDKKLKTDPNNVGKTSNLLKYDRRTGVDTRPSSSAAHVANTTYKFDDLDFPPMGEAFTKNTPKKLHQATATREIANQIEKETNLQRTAATRETIHQTENVPTTKICDKQLLSKEMISNQPKYDSKDMLVCLLEPASRNTSKNSPKKGKSNCVPSASATSISTDDSRTQLMAETSKAGSGKTPMKMTVQVSTNKPLSTVTSSSSVSTSSTTKNAQRETYAQVMQSSLTPKTTTPAQRIAATKPSINATKNLFNESSSSTTCSRGNDTNRQPMKQLKTVKSTNALARIEERSGESRISCIAKQFDDDIGDVGNWLDDVIPPSGTTDKHSLRKRRRNRRSKRLSIERYESAQLSSLNNLLISPKGDDLLEFPPLPKQSNQNMLDMSMRSNVEALNGAGDASFFCDKAKEKPLVFETNMLFANDDTNNNVSSGVEHFSFLQSPDEDEIPIAMVDDRFLKETEIGKQIMQTTLDCIEGALEGSNINVGDETKSSERNVAAAVLDSKQPTDCTMHVVDAAKQHGNKYIERTETIGDSLCVNVDPMTPNDSNVQSSRTSRRKRRRPRRRNALRQNAALSSMQISNVPEANNTPPQEPPTPPPPLPAPHTVSNYQSNYVYVPSQAQNNSNQSNQQHQQQQQVVPFVYETFYQQPPYQPYYQQQQMPLHQSHMHMYPYHQQLQQQHQQQPGCQYIVSRNGPAEMSGNYMPTGQGTLNPLPVYTVSSVMQTSNPRIESNPAQSIQQLPHAAQSLQYVVAQPYMLQNPPNGGGPTPLYSQQGPILLSSQMPMRRASELNATLPSTISGSNRANNMMISPIFDTHTQQMLQSGELYNTNSCSLSTASGYMQSPIFTMSSQSSFMQLDHERQHEWQNERQQQWQEQQRDQPQQQQQQRTEEQNMTESVFSLTPPVYRPRVNKPLSSYIQKKTRQYKRKSVYMQAAAAVAVEDISNVCSVHTQTTETTTTTAKTNENNLLQLFTQSEEQQQTQEEEEQAARILSESKRAMLASRSYVVQSQIAIMKRRSEQSKLHMQSPEVAFYSQMAPFLENIRKELQFTTIYRPVKSRNSILDLNLLPPAIKKLYEIVTPRYSEYAFVYALSAQLCQERVPMDSYVYFKMSLLLSLASFEDKPESNRPPISLMVICYDTYMANYLLNTVGELAKRFVGPYDDVRPPVHVNTARFTWNEANPVMLAQGGVYYAGNWKRVKVPSADTLLKFVENSTVNSERSEKDYPLETAIWSHWHPEDGPDLETFHKFFKVFGLPIFMEDDIDEVIMNYILHQYRVQVFESSTDFLSIPLEEMREFLAMIAKQQVSFSANATNLLQRYFVVTRLARPNVLSKQTYVVLKQFAESFAKLSLRNEVLEVDVVSSIFLCETFIQHIYGRSDIPPPDFVTFNYIAMVDSYMNVFYNWLKVYLNNDSAKKSENSSNHDNNDKRTARDLDEDMPLLADLFETEHEEKTTRPTHLDLD